MSLLFLLRFRYSKLIFTVTRDETVSNDQLVTVETTANMIILIIRVTILVERYIDCERNTFPQKLPSFKRDRNRLTTSFLNCSQIEIIHREFVRVEV